MNLIPQNAHNIDIKKNGGYYYVRTYTVFTKQL